MQSTRRGLLWTFSGVVAALFATRVTGSRAIAQMSPGPPQPMPSPNAPSNMNAPIQLDQQDIPLHGLGNPIPPATWKEIKDDAQRLYLMAASFATQIDNTNTAITLPVGLMKQAHAIEKLAKHIQQRMRG